MVAGIVTLQGLAEPGVWDGLEQSGQRLIDGLCAAAEAAGVPIQAGRAGSMFGFFFSNQPVTNWATAKVADTKRFARFFQSMLENGVYLAPSQFEAGFLSTVHSDTVIDATIHAAEKSFASLTT